MISLPLLAWALILALGVLLLACDRGIRLPGPTWFEIIHRPQPRTQFPKRGRRR